MSTINDINSLLDTALDGVDTTAAELSDNTASVELMPVPEDGIDLRLKRMSYSSTLTLHACPRRYQLDKLQAIANPIDDISQQVTFDYGHVVGQGIQDALDGLDDTTIYMNAFLDMWSGDLLAELPRKKKSFWYAMAAIKRFIALREQGYLNEYELLYVDGKPAVELGFKIIMPDGFTYRGFVDAILVHKHTGQVVVLELKTTGSNNINSAQYKNSAQAIGYSIVLDFLVPDVNAYTVLYLIYSSTSLEYTELPFDKSYYQRALWLRDLQIDREHVAQYCSYGDHFPMRGESCYDFFTECKYLSLCQMDTDTLIKLLTVTEYERMVKEDEDKYPYVVTFEQLVESQLSREI